MEALALTVGVIDTVARGVGAGVRGGAPAGWVESGEMRGVGNLLSQQSSPESQLPPSLLHWGQVYLHNRAKPCIIDHS